MWSLDKNSRGTTRPKMKIVICFVVLIAATARASLEDDFYKLEKAVQDKLVLKVGKAYGSLKQLTDNIKAMEKAFPDDFKIVDSKLETFLSNIEELTTDAEALYLDKEKGKSFALALKMVETGAKLTEVELEFKSMKPLFQQMVKARLTGAKSALSELSSFMKTIVHVANGGLSEELSKVSDFISEEVPTSIFAKVTSAYRKVKTGLDAVEKLAKQYPEVYRSIKDDIPDLEITLKSLYEDIMAIAADKEKGDMILMMIKVTETGEKLAHLIGIVDKIKPEVEDLLSETKGSARLAVAEVEQLLQILHPNSNTVTNVLEKLLETVIGKQKTQYLTTIYNFIEHLDSYLSSAKTKFHGMKDSTMTTLLQLEEPGKKVIADFKKLYEDARDEHLTGTIEDMVALKQQLKTLKQQLEGAGKVTKGELYNVIVNAEHVIEALTDALD